MSSQPPFHIRHEAALCEIGQRVRARRDELGKTTRAVADGRPFSQSWISRLEKGQQNLSLSYLLELAEALDVDVVDLVRGLSAN